MSIVKQVNGKYRTVDTVATERGARTMTVDSKNHRGVPAGRGIRACAPAATPGNEPVLRFFRTVSTLSLSVNNIHRNDSPDTT